MGVTVLIPARFGSTRFPGKVLAAETGRPLVVHVCDRAASAPGVDRVCVATDDERIERAVALGGFESVRTSEDHPNGTSRLLEAAETLRLGADTVVVNVQGDEPEIEPEVIEAAVEALRSTTGPLNAVIGTVASPIESDDDPASPNVVKVVLEAGEARMSRNALYFSRALVPFPRQPSVSPPLRHIGIYAYTVAALRRYATLQSTPLEQAESLEQLRWLEHGLQIRVAVRESIGKGVDTPEDYEAFVRRFRASNRISQ